MKFVCEKCGTETKCHNGRITLTCQQCGCFDLHFDVPMVVIPVLHGGDLGPKIFLEPDEPFFGKNEQGGAIWDIKEMPLNKPSPLIPASPELQKVLDEEVGPSEEKIPDSPGPDDNQEKGQDEKKEEILPKKKKTIIKRVKELKLNLKNE